MQRLRRLQTPQLYQVKLSHLAPLAAVLTLYATTPLRIIRLKFEFCWFSLSLPSRPGSVTVCPHRGRGELCSEDQLWQNGNRIVLLDFLGFGPATLQRFW